ncbi:orc1/cdc6 family replication initiation protein (plasmid) [Halorutilales archaeon Cl-col2-1]
MGVFEKKNTIFENEDVFRDDYQPDKIYERDEELDDYIAALQPVVNGAIPRNIFLYGKTGVGKTVATRFLMDQLKQDIDDGIDLSIVNMNCTNLNSTYQVAINLVNKLKEKQGKSEIKTSGYPQQDVFNMLYDELDELGGTILIVLDEIDNIGSDDTLLYELPRARANGYVDDAKPGVIGISNKLSFKRNLSSKVKDSLCDEEINFSPYDANQLREILSRRAEKGFKDGVLGESVIQLASALAAQDRGSARQALDLLYKAGDIARRSDSDTVEEKHLKKADRELEKDQIKEGIDTLTTQGRLTLLTVVKLSLKDDPPFRTRDIYPEYRDLARRGFDIDPLVRRRMHDHLKDLGMLGILEIYERYEGKQGGSYYEYELDIPLNSAVEAFGEQVGTDQRHRINLTDDIKSLIKRNGLM